MAVPPKLKNIVIFEIYGKIGWPLAGFGLPEAKIPFH
jgi:hypothetical protein